MRATDENVMCLSHCIFKIGAYYLPATFKGERNFAPVNQNTGNSETELVYQGIKAFKIDVVKDVHFYQ